MDDITRSGPADAGRMRSRPQRTKGPAELASRDSATDAVAEEPDVTMAPEHWGGGHDGPDHGHPANDDGPELDAGAAPPDDDRPDGDLPDQPSGDPASGDPASGDPASGDPASGDPASGDVRADDAAAALAAAAETLEIVEDAPLTDQEGLPAVPELASPEQLARIVFVLVLTQREGLSVLRLAQACNSTQKLVEQALELLAGQLESSGMPVELCRTGDTIRLLSAAETFPYLQRLRGVKKLEKLSPAALETLAVVAYRQPVIRGEIEAIRGVKAGPMLRTLLSHKLVRVTGRADVPGRPLQYGTTQRFLDRFGLASLQELPSIKEFKQLG